MTARNQLPAFHHERYRADIQSLRGLAILLVLLHHAKLLPWLKAGYLGVDVFFVVSGYLITGIIQRGLLAGSFTFSGFYFRRAKRLLPAAYVTFAATALLSAVFLTRPEMRDFIWQLLGAVTFTGNIVLWMQTGYFEGAANLKPLLHVWSLSIEEQYYLLLPAALVVTPRRYWKLGALAVVVLSFGLCLALLATKPGAVFYLLPTRAWELALGSLGVLALEGSQAGAWLARLFWPALAALLVVPSYPTGTAHPGLDALIVCMATLVIILRRHPALNAGLPARGLARLGDISYSLYLVHWPLLAFAANAWVSDVPQWVRAMLAAVSVVLAWALYRWVENPIRKADIAFSRKSLGTTLGVSVVVLAMGVGVNSLQSWGRPVDYGHLRRANTGFGSVCDQAGATLEHKSECANSNAPVFLVWGDSYAMHLVDGIVASTDKGVAQATKSLCGPFLGVSVYYPGKPGFTRPFAHACLGFNDAVLAYIASQSSIEVVVLSSWFEQYLAGSPLLAYAGSQATGAARLTMEKLGSQEAALESLRQTVSAVRALGRRVVLVSRPPMVGFNPGRCQEIRANGKAFFGADRPTCAIDEAKHQASGKDVLSFLDRASRELDLPVVRLDDVLCHAGTCITEMNGVILYRDGGHLSVDGSRELGRQMGLARQLMAVAR